MANTGGAFGGGCLFSVDTNGAAYKDMIDFGGANGAIPYGSLTYSSGQLFGMTTKGGANNDGLIFSLDSNGTSFKDVLDFNGANGSTPEGSITLSGNVMYGMTYYGGAHDSGCIFTVDTTGSNYSDLYDFDLSSGYYPYADVTLSGTTLYGMTPFGAANKVGVVFSFKDLLLGLNELNQNTEEVKLYPNPSNGVFQLGIRNYVPISIGIGEQYNLKVYDILGQIIYSSQLSIKNSAFNIDLSGKSAGVYLYRLIGATGEQIAQGKFVIEK